MIGARYDGARDPMHGVGAHVGNASASCPTSPRYLQHFASPLLPSRDGDAIIESKNCWRAYHLWPAHKTAKTCTSPFAAASSSADPPIATCADLLASRYGKLRHIRLVLGITSAPDKWGAKRRDGIRKTWFRFHGVGRWTLACFVVGRIGVKKKDLAKLDAEAAVHGDVIFLRGTQDGRGPFVTISKLHAWFRLASELLGLIDRGPDAASMEDEAALLKPDNPRKPITTGPLGASVRHIAKVDDDTFIHLPVMQSDLDSLHCVNNLYYGIFSHSGYNPITFTKCGFDYGPAGGRYRRYNCANATGKAHGAAHPPFPWTSGALMLASTPLIVRLASDPAIGEFVRRSADPTLPHQPDMKPGHNTDEDVAMGFWLSRFHRSAVAPITYVRINERLTNLGCRMHSGLYRPPRNHSVGSHFVKSAGGMEYVWGLLVNGDKHNVTKCHIMTGDYRL